MSKLPPHSKPIAGGIANYGPRTAPMQARSFRPLPGGKEHQGVTHYGPNAQPIAPTFAEPRPAAPEPKQGIVGYTANPRPVAPVFHHTSKLASWIERLPIEIANQPRTRAFARVPLRVVYSKVETTEYGKDALRRGLMLDYDPTNLDVYCLAYDGAFAGMSDGRVLSGTSFVPQALAAGIWAQTFDTLWADAATIDEIEALIIYGQSYAVWSGRNPASITAANATPTITAIIAAIDEVEAYLASEGITPPMWGGGGGGGVPPVPANSAGVDILTSINSTGSSQPALTGSAWLPSGGYAILSFAKNHGATFEVGFTDVSPTFTASYNVTPNSAEIVYTQQAGSPLVLVTPFTSGQILETFVSDTNGVTATFTLEAVFPTGTKTSVLTDTWGLPFLEIIDTTTNVVATQAYLDTMRAAHAAQVHTTATGTYLAGLTVGAGQISAIAIPTALDVGVVWTDNETGLPVSPSFIGTVAGYMNPQGIVVSMNLYTVGGIDVGVVSWGLS